MISKSPSVGTVIHFMHQGLFPEYKIYYPNNSEVKRGWMQGLSCKSLLITNGMVLFPIYGLTYPHISNLSWMESFLIIGKATDSFHYCF